MKLVIKRKYFGYIWIFLTFLIPYIEIAAVRNLLEVKTDDMVIPAVFPVMLLLWAYLWCANRLNGYHKKSGISKYLHGIDIGFFIFILIMAFTAIINDAQGHHFLQMLMILLPYLFARESLLHIKGYGFRDIEIVKYGVTFFAIIQMFFFVINIVVYGFSFNGEASSRIISVGGGPVVLGYTVALVFSAWLLFREQITSKWYWSVTVCCLLVTLATGSRGGMWPVLLLLFIGFMCRRGKLSANRSIVTLIFAFLIMGLFDFQTIFPRLFLFGNNSRVSAIVGNLGAYQTFSFLEQLLGKGIGMFYPYQLWLLDNSLACFHDYNRFFYNGVSLLVQPHNTYVYVLMETGLLGFASFILLLKRAVFGKRMVQRKTKLGHKMFVITFFFLLSAETTLFVELGSASLWWFILILIGSSEDKFTG